MACVNPLWFGCEMRFADFTADATVAPLLNMKRGWLGSISETSPQGDGKKTIGRAVTGFKDFKKQPNPNLRRGWQSLRVPQCGQDCTMVGGTFTERPGLEAPNFPGWEQERVRHAVCVAHWSENVGGGDCGFPCTINARFVQQPAPCAVGGEITQEIVDEAQFVSDFLFTGQPWILDFVPVLVPRTPTVTWSLFEEGCNVYILDGPHGPIRPSFTVGMDAQNDGELFFIITSWVRLYGGGEFYLLTATIRLNWFPHPPGCANMNQHVYGTWPADFNCGEHIPIPFQGTLVTTFRFSGTTVVEPLV